MSDSTAVTTRTNHFAVVDAPALAAALAPYGVHVHRQPDSARVRLSSSHRWTAAVADTVGEFLAGGAVALFMHTDALDPEGAYAFAATETATLELHPGMTV